MTQFEELTGAQTVDITYTVLLNQKAEMPLAAKPVQWRTHSQCMCCAMPFLTYMVSLLILHILSQIQTGLTALFIQYNSGAAGWQSSIEQITKSHVKVNF